ncbi:MAG: hypothetical protein IT372_37570 [Polyangiaceae bacterium]|nr:hypothetical protein [Polyangiaceae bacterium]
MNAREAARALERALAGQGKDFTIADATAKSGLALRDAERGLHALVSEYRGHLRVTSEGELLFRFPHGFTKPWLVRSALERAARAAARGFVGVLRFVVRAWITIVLVAYVAIFLAIMIGLLFARGSSDDRRDRGDFSFGGSLLFRVLADALFWTFHPFSPFVIADQAAWGSPQVARRAERRRDETPFYEKVNRFFFGPSRPEPEPRALERRVLAEIRAQKGRVGLADVMRVTGLPRDEADPLMARLMLDYDGTVDVSEEGGIVYRFASLRRSVAEGQPARRPEPIWARMERQAPLTGNQFGTNLLIVLLNSFNLLASLWVMDHGLTIDNLTRALFQRVPLEKLPFDGTPIALGLVPFVFSLALFALPIARAALRPLRERRIARENGRRAVLRAVLDGVGAGGVKDEALREAYRKAAGRDPDPKELTREVVALGGDVDLAAAEGGVRSRFPDLEAEAAALKAEREAAAEEEAKVGKVIFTSER